jgi:hypothetical protein
VGLVLGLVIPKRAEGARGTCCSLLGGAALQRCDQAAK